MRLKPFELLHRLKNECPRVIWLSGQEPLLNEAIAEDVIALLMAQGFSHERFFAPDFSWDTLEATFYTEGLFAEKRLLDIDLRQEKLTSTAQTFLQNAANASPGNTVLLIRANERDSAFLKTKWFKTFETTAFVVIQYRARFDETLAYCKRLIKQFNLSPKIVALASEFARSYQHNLLGLKQALVNLSFLDQDQLSTSDLHPWLHGEVSGTLYEWANWLLVGRLDQALPLFATLKKKEVESLLLLWGLVRQLKRVHTVQCSTALSKASALYLSPEDRTAITQAARRIPPALFPEIWAKAAHIDAVIKGAALGDPNALLLDLSLQVGGARAI